MHILLDEMGLDQMVLDKVGVWYSSQLVSYLYLLYIPTVWIQRVWLSRLLQYVVHSYRWCEKTFIIPKLRVNWDSRSSHWH